MQEQAKQKNLKKMKKLNPFQIAGIVFIIPSIIYLFAYIVDNEFKSHPAPATTTPIESQYLTANK